MDRRQRRRRARGYRTPAVIRTFLIADVRGYTRFTQAHGDEEAGKLAARFAVLAREAVTGSGGELIELRGFAATHPDGAIPSARYVLEAAQAAEALLEAIGRSDGSRTSVTRELRHLEIQDGILGTFTFDENGDMTPPTISVFRVTGKKREADAPDLFGGADFDRLVRVAPELVGS